MRKSILKIAVVACIMTMCFALFGCGSSSGSAAPASSAPAPSEAASASSEAAPEPAAPSEPTLGSTIEFDGFTIAFGDSIELTDYPYEYGDHAGELVVNVPVTITNNNDESKGLNFFYVTCFGSNGSKTDGVYTFYEDDPLWGNDLRPGATLEGHFHFLYDGDGDYYMEFDNYKVKYEVKIPVQG